MMEASYEVLGDAQSDAASEEEIDDINGEEVRATVEAMSKGYKVRAGIATFGFALAVLGIWGDGAPKAVIYAA
jgi:autophagy-related protein 33